MQFPSAVAEALFANLSVSSNILSLSGQWVSVFGAAKTTSTTSATNAIVINAMVVMVNTLFFPQNLSEDLIARPSVSHCEKHNGYQT